VLYYNGQGVPQDDVRAHMWFDLAAECYPAASAARRANAVRGRDTVAARMTPAQLDRAGRLVREWLAAHAGAVQP
jgi:uncharacterized protein